ncbi:MAG: GvpL/GvpF family gas vesicle protein [Anaerolineales bacterium]|nr:GvpL/GvpF family gas vesicle protein [Anaerolineales bacterium]
MTRCYWYAIVASSITANFAAWGTGLREMPLAMVEEGQLAAIVSEWQESTLSRSQKEVDASLVWQHEQVIERIMHDVTLLPVRFGTIMAGPDDVREVLRERHQTMLGDLQHLAGCVEIGVRVLWQPPTTMSPIAGEGAAQTSDRTGRGYLMRRAAEEQARDRVVSQAREIASELDAVLRTEVVDARVTLLETERMLMKAAYLVRRDHLSTFMSHVNELRAGYPALAFLSTGPWPPYHFVSA